jgi:hypothetical protein
MKKTKVKDLETNMNYIEFMLSLCGSMLGQYVQDMPKEDRDELMHICLDCTDHAAAIARINILTLK